MGEERERCPNYIPYANHKDQMIYKKIKGVEEKKQEEKEDENSKDREGELR